MDDDYCIFSCGHKADMKIVDHRFEYGADRDNAVWLTATVPVFSCEKCDESWLNYIGSALIDHAIAKHLEKNK